MLGKWNKSVILSYVGLGFSVLGIFLLSLHYKVKYAQVCLIFAGVCDMFDGTVARRCKRTKEEKEFGIQLDSLIDVISFIAFPIIILLSLKLNYIYALPIYVMYAVFGVARLAYFNITVEDTNKSRKVYEGLPVTLAALIFPLIYLLSYVVKQNIFNIIYLLTMLVVSILFVTRFKISKPGKKLSALIILSAITVTILYLFVL